MSQIYKPTTSPALPSDVPINFVTDNGIASAVASVLNVVGGSNANTSGAGNTITINSVSVPIFNPNSTLNLYDDFISAVPPADSSAQNLLGQLGWFPLNFFQDRGFGNNPGVLSNGNAALAALSLFDTSNYSIFAGSGSISVNFVISLRTLSILGNRYTYSIGIADSVTPTNGVYFTYIDNVNAGNWVLNATKSSVTTSTNSSIAAVTGFINLGIVVNAAGTSASFTVNGVSAGSVNANIPTNGLFPYISITRSSGALPVTFVDLFYMSINLTTPR